MFPVSEDLLNEVWPEAKRNSRYAATKKRRSRLVNAVGTRDNLGLIQDEQEAGTS